MASSSGSHFVQADGIRHLDFPWCHVEELSTAGSVGAERLFMVRATMPAGEAHNFHRHPGREELLYILQGRAEQWVGGEKRLLRVGDMAHIPPNVPHATFNPGPEVLRFLAVLSPVEVDGPFTVDVFDEDPWCALRPAVVYPGYTPRKE